MINLLHVEPATAINVQINGQPLIAEANETILNCARRHGIYIPTLCELNDIDHAPGTCRVCLIEMRMPDREQFQTATACDTPVREGMEILTNTPKMRQMRRLQVELLLADHNQDCATCVRHGNCELQDVAQYVGLQTNRFFDPARVAARPVDRSSPAMVRDLTKCIRCQRCVAICRDVQKVDALAITGSGQSTAVGLHYGPSQKESTCVTCGQCVLVCPTGALGARSETEAVLDMLYNPEIVTVFQFAPAVRVGFGEEFGLPAGTNVEGKIISALRRIGADIVLDTNFAADVVIMEEGTELLRRLSKKQRPTFTSCCPAWINFAERHYPDILPLLSSTKSPQQCLGKIAKTYLPEQMGIDPARIRVISIMPCIAKKDERTRSQLSEDGIYDVDVVLTTREFAHLLKRLGINLANMEPSTFDNPYMTAYSGAGAIFGTTGGVMEAALRTMYKIVTGSELKSVELTQLRGFEGLRSASVDFGNSLGVVNVAMCHGLKAAREIVEAVRSGKADYDFIEIMACPGGCVDGGGTLRSKKAYMTHAMKRRETMYAIDHSATIRQSHNNPQVKALYENFLESPYSEKAHHLLHTYYTDRHINMVQTVKDIWNEITMSTMVY
jgi:ferredoxin hydrogenase gamma subunit